MTVVYRLFRQSGDLDPKPYTYNYTLRSGGLVPQRVARTAARSQASTVVFYDPTSTASDIYMTGQGQSTNKVDADEETAGHIAVFVKTGFQHTVDFDSGERAKKVCSLSETGHGSGCP
jgi:hypothetical protein